MDCFYESFSSTVQQTKLKSTKRGKKQLQQLKGNMAYKEAKESQPENQKEEQHKIENEI